MDVLDVMKIGSKTWVIWASCIDEPRSLMQIMEKWGYKTGAGAMYRANLINEMIKNKVISLAKIQKGNCYTSNFDWLTKDMLREISAKSGTPVQKIILDILGKNFEEYLGFLNKKETREVLFRLDNIIKFYNNKPSMLRDYPHNLLILPVSVFINYSYPQEVREMLEEMTVVFAKQIYSRSIFDLIGYSRSLDEEKVRELAVPKFIGEIAEKAGKPFEDVFSKHLGR